MAKIDDYKFTDDGISSQDILIAGMSPQQIRIYRKNAQKIATTSGRHASSHNNDQKALEKAIQQGERLTNAGLERLIKEAKSKAGIDAGELLDFTLGNTKRNTKINQMRGLKPFSPEILDYYLANVKKAAKHFLGGITPRQVINQSRPIDIKRANEQIFLATTFKRKGNEIYWLTNAGPESKSQNHKVVTALLDYPILMTGATNLPTRQQIKNLLENGKIKFDCDCGRHQYWYRYIATVGKFNFGSHENRYPSTRNPQLTGVACKHVLRVMHQMMSEYGVQKVRGYMKADLQHSNKGKSQRATPAQIRAESQKQAHHRSAEHWRKKIQQQLKAVMKTFKPLTTAQQHQALKQLQAVGITLSPEQQAMFTSYQNNLQQVPYK